MTDEFIEEYAHEEIVAEEIIPEPLTKGYIRMNALDFDTWNNHATVEANANGFACEPYTSSRADVNPNKIWARVEHEYVLKDFGIIINTVLLSEEDAILQGMQPTTME